MSSTWKSKMEDLQTIEQHRQEVCLGNLKKFHFRELQLATNNFSSKNLIGKGGFGNVYKGYLQDGTVIAVKRLKDGNAIGATKRLLVYPYMSNGNVASRLKGVGRGLLYLHEQCDPKIIHRDVKARNILLDDYCEVVVGDFGLAKLLDHRDSHVTTAVRGTVGHIAPEYLSTGQSSEKIDVFGFGILLLELISGQRALDFGKTASEEIQVLQEQMKEAHASEMDSIKQLSFETETARREEEEMRSKTQELKKDAEKSKAVVEEQEKKLEFYLKQAEGAKASKQRAIEEMKMKT
ncbi:hypothetical protein JHK82_019038 [Glycine max]|nr:hypothetical protein JHK85_019480 [Glycine max]KAG5038220.1 hypothetical protein JHK86_019060 [Glycine max]KAG5143343.1 hypothetical protein JHK82_019038 [Glycine max]